MKKNRCDSGPVENNFTTCHADFEQKIQPMPTGGQISKNIGLPLSGVKSKYGNSEVEAYSYVLKTVQLHSDGPTFEQHGSGPNFQGDILTLCTCKHQMRASRSTSEWKSVWLAGFTSRTIYDGKHWLFYLAQVQSAHESHTDLWNSLPHTCRKAKAADAHFLGDIFRPLKPAPVEHERFFPSRYVVPEYHAHRQSPGDTGWRNDIRYKHAKRYGNPPMLVADPKRTFLWNEPMIYLDQKHYRNFSKWTNLSELVAKLRDAK